MSFDNEYPAVGVDPPLADAQSPSDIPNGYLTSMLEIFDFRAMKNKYRNFNRRELESCGKDARYYGTCAYTEELTYRRCSWRKPLER